MRYTARNGKEATVDTDMLAWLRPVTWAAAIILFIVGGYSDTNTTECWAWAFALVTGGLLVKELALGRPDT